MIRQPLIFMASALCLLISLGGCAESVKEQQGAAITLVPITQTLSLNVERQGMDAAKAELKQAIEKNLAVIEAKDIRVHWHTEAGKQLADYAKSVVRSYGVSTDYFVLVPCAGDCQSDVSFSFTDVKVVTRLCSYPAVGKFGADESSCFVDNARWQSMVNPEKMLPAQAVSQ